MYRILMHVSDATACAYYRAMLPYIHCKDELAKKNISLHISDRISNDYKFDCYIFHRLLNPSFFPLLWDMKFNAKKKIVFDLDDNLFKIPSWSPAREMMEGTAVQTLMTCLEWSDYITLTTDNFKRQLSAYDGWASKIHVLPNLIGMKDWSFPQHVPHLIRPGNPLKILWAGSITHHGDLEIIASACEEILKTRENIKFVFMGMMPDSLRVGEKKNNNEILKDSVIMINNCDLNFYPQVLNLIAPHIALIPIEANDFNYAKSNIKYLEMSMAGATCIASNFGPYKNTITHGYNGFLSENNHESWYENINKCIDIILHQNCSTIINSRAKKKILSKYTWDSQSKDYWMDFFQLLAE